MPHAPILSYLDFTVRQLTIAQELLQKIEGKMRHNLRFEASEDGSSQGLQTLAVLGTLKNAQDSVQVGLEKINLHTSIQSAALARARQLLLGAGIGSWTFWPQDNIFEFDEIGRELLGLGLADTHQHLAGWQDRIHPDDKAAATQTFTHFVHGQFRSYETSHRLLHGNGQWVWVLVRGVLTEMDQPDPKDKPDEWASRQVIKVIGTIQDVTSLKDPLQAAARNQSDQDMTKLQELEEKAKNDRMRAIYGLKLASLVDLAADVIHDINNPLAVIAGTLHWIPKYLNDPKAIEQKITVMDNAVQRILAILNGLKKFSRSQDQKHFDAYKLVDMIKDSLLATAHQAKRTNTKVILEGDEDGLVWCEELDIAQVFINLIRNGIDACEPLPERWIKIVLKDEPEHTTVRIYDSGKGIAVDVRGKIYEPFFSTKPFGKGAGRGLAMVKSILEEHHATIELISDENNTCFEVRFPRYRGKSQMAS